MYNDHTLGKRSFPKQTYNDRPSSNFNRRRDAKKQDNSSKNDFDMIGGISAVGQTTDGDYSNYPEIPQESVKVLTQNGFFNLFPIQ